MNDSHDLFGRPQRASRGSDELGLGLQPPEEKTSRVEPARPSFDCQCQTATLALERATTNGWVFQIVFCEVCETEFGHVVRSASVEDTDDA
jgi:hypothetical protein